jgi:hypothetical protein
MSARHSADTFEPAPVPASTLRASLHAQAAALTSIRATVTDVLAPDSTQYPRWRDQVLQTLRRYALADHVLPTVAAPTEDWLLMDEVVLSWIHGTLTAELQDIVRVPDDTAHRIWGALEAQFLGNRKTRILYLETAFRQLVQGDLSVDEYCRQMKTMADTLRTLGAPMTDESLVLNLLRGLSPRFDRVAPILTRMKPFPTFAEAKNDLLLEEFCLSAAATTAPATALYSAPRAAPSDSGEVPAPRTPAPLPSGALRQTACFVGARSRGRDRGRKGGCSGGGPSGGRSGSLGGSQWPSFYNPWTGTIHMWPGPSAGASAPRPTASQQVFFAAAPPAAPSTPPQPQQGLLPHLGSSDQPMWGPWTNGWDAQSLASSFSTMTLAPPTSVSDWVADSGASYHTTLDACILSSTSPAHPSLRSSIIVGNRSALPVTSVGDAVLPGPFRLTNVLVAPHIIQNLLSIRQFTTDNSCSMEFDPFGLSVKDLATMTLLARCDSPGPLYTFRLLTPTTSTSAPHVLAAAASSATWHRRLGHPGRDVMSKLSSSTSVSGCRGSFEHLRHACQLGCHVRLPFPTSSSRAADIFDLIHCDVWTSPVISISGYKYYLLILDDFSHYLWTFPLRQKSDTFPTLSHFFAWVCTQFGRTIRSIQCDNGHEFYNNASRDFFLSRGIHLRMSCPYTSPPNGRAERMIRTTNDVVLSLLFQASLPAHYWAEALATATYLLNRLPTKAVLPTPLLTLLFSASTPPITIFAFSGALATLISPPLLLIN